MTETTSAETTAPVIYKEVTIPQGSEVEDTSTEKIVTYVSENPSIVRILSNGLIVGVAPGTATVTITRTDGTTEVIQVTITAVDNAYEYDFTSNDAFYCTHELDEFDPAGLVSDLRRRTVSTDGTKGEWEAVDFSVLNFVSTPAETYKAPYFTGGIEAVIKQELPNGELYTSAVTVGDVTIAMLGDADLNGDVDALDAATVLMYAAAAGAGETPAIYSSENAEAESIALKCADTDGNGEINAIDAANVLMYSAIMGAEATANWSDVLAAKEEPND